MTLYISGKNSVKDAIDNNMNIKRIFLISKRDLLPIYQNYKIEYITKEKMDSLVETNHQGVIAQLPDFNYANLNIIEKEEASKVLILDHLQDPQNLGAILRSANAFGWNYIIIPSKRSTSINNTVLKVSSGGFVNLHIIQVDSLVATINYLKNNGFWIYGTSLTNATDINKIKDATKVALIIGNEQNGINNAIQKQLDFNVKINLEGSVQSLNASVATGICLFYFNSIIKK